MIIKRLKSIDEFKRLTKNHLDNITLYSETVKLNKLINNFILYQSISTIVSFIFKNLKALDLQKNNIGSKGVLILKVYIKNSENLVYLNLSYNNLCDEGLKYFSDCLKMNKTVQNVNLECNNINDEGFNYFINNLKFYRALKVLKLALNLITYDGLKNLSNMLDNNKMLIFNLIDLKYNNIIIVDNECIMDSLNLHKVII